MKKYAFCAFLMSAFFTGSCLLYAEEGQKTQEAVVSVETTTVSEAAPALPAPSTEGQVQPVVVKTPPAVETPPPAAPAEEADNLEFISGEISAVDETVKTATVKLYGEADDAKSQKLLTVKIDESTDITDGEKNRDLKSLTAGTEVDVEYDPATNKATYIFVY